MRRKSSRSSRRDPSTPAYALFGTIALQRAYCPWCEHTALVIDGKIACCGKPFIIDPLRSERESLSPLERQRVPKAKRDAILLEQGGRCIYCGLPFGCTIYRDDRTVVLRLNWEHIVPWSYDGNKDVVAACHVCNGIKHDLFFRTIEEATVHIRDRRAQLGYVP